MTAVTILLSGEADDDVFENINSAKGQQLKAAINAGNSLVNDIAFAARPQSGDYLTDAFQIPGNPYTSPWPAWKETPLPLANNQANANFGSWNTQGTTFTFSKGGLFQVNGSFGFGYVPQGNYVNDLRCVIRLILAYGNAGAENKIEAVSWQTAMYNNTPNIMGGAGTFSKHIRVTTGQTLGLIIARTRFNSSNSSDAAITGISTPPIISDWVEIVQVRGE